MFKNSSPQSDLNGLLDGGSHITGELSFDNEFHIHGKVTGKVVSKGDLYVGMEGEVDGEVEVGKIFVSGVVRGTMRIAERTQIVEGGKVFADIFTPALVIEEGAFFEGRCSMGHEGAGGQSKRTSETGPREAGPREAGSSKVAKMPMAK